MARDDVIYYHQEEGELYHMQSQPNHTYKSGTRSSDVESSKGTFSRELREEDLRVEGRPLDGNPRIYKDGSTEYPLSRRGALKHHTL